MNSLELPPLRGRFSFYRIWVRPLLFRFDPEKMHHLITTCMRLFFKLPFSQKFVHAVYARKIKSYPIRLSENLTFRNPLGLAAGFDKNGTLLPGIENLGFGFIEIGTVTPRPQLGNPTPRLFRVPERRALLNRLGFNNDGAEIVYAHLKRVKNKVRVPVGVNIGKNRDTPNTSAIKDYETLFKIFYPHADYFTVNISSPNTPGLRDLQSGEFIRQLGDRILHHRLPQPILVKLAPDIHQDDLNDICRMCGPEKPYAGLVLTNTLPTDLGGVSGYPLKGPSIHLLKIARTLLDPKAFIISVGGVETGEDLIERLQLGANAVQIYSTLIYGGPSAPSRILKSLERIPVKKII
jgi:dihydroorotate dehydrogenase